MAISSFRLGRVSSLQFFLRQDTQHRYRKYPFRNCRYSAPYITGLTQLCRLEGMTTYGSNFFAARCWFSEPKSRRKYVTWFGNIHRKNKTKIVIIVLLIATSSFSRRLLCALAWDTVGLRHVNSNFYVRYSDRYERRYILKDKEKYSVQFAIHMRWPFLRTGAQWWHYDDLWSNW